MQYCYTKLANNAPKSQKNKTHSSTAISTRIVNKTWNSMKCMKQDTAEQLIPHSYILHSSSSLFIWVFPPHLPAWIYYTTKQNYFSWESEKRKKIFTVTKNQNPKFKTQSGFLLFRGNRCIDGIGNLTMVKNLTNPFLKVSTISTPVEKIHSPFPIQIGQLFYYSSLTSHHKLVGDSPFHKTQLEICKDFSEVSIFLHSIYCHNKSSHIIYPIFLQKKLPN